MLLATAGDQGLQQHVSVHPTGRSAVKTRAASLCEAHGEPRDDASVPATEWTLKRNCSLSPAAVLAVYASLCVISLGIATYFWVHGATLVMPFAWAELLVFGAALLVYARHATDRERIVLVPGRLTVEHLCGGRVERVEFVPQWVNVADSRDGDSLVELSGGGHVVRVGRYLPLQLRRAWAEEFRAALTRQCSTAVGDGERRPGGDRG